ncbi:unnamed protein product, partial [Brenthis ino]
MRKAIAILLILLSLLSWISLTHGRVSEDYAIDYDGGTDDLSFEPNLLPGQPRIGHMNNAQVNQPRSLSMPTCPPCGPAFRRRSNLFPGGVASQHIYGNNARVSQSNVYQEDPQKCKSPIPPPVEGHDLNRLGRSRYKRESASGNAPKSTKGIKAGKSKKRHTTTDAIIVKRAISTTPDTTTVSSLNLHEFPSSLPEIGRESATIIPSAGVVIEQSGAYMEFSGYVYVPILYHMPQLLLLSNNLMEDGCNITEFINYQKAIMEILENKIGSLIPQHRTRRTKRFLALVALGGAVAWNRASIASLETSVEALTQQLTAVRDQRLLVTESINMLSTNFLSKLPEVVKYLNNIAHLAV